ncbi:MAG: T9SS type A sorting domain-containing protein [Cytophagaceae bacterium]
MKKIYQLIPIAVLIYLIPGDLMAQLPGTWTFNQGCNGYSGACVNNTPGPGITTTGSSPNVTYNLTSFGSRTTTSMWNNTVVSLNQSFTLSFQICFGNHAETQVPPVGGEGIAFGMQGVNGTTPAASQLTSGGYGGGDLGMKCLQSGGASAFPNNSSPANARTIITEFDVFDNTAGAGCTGGCLHSGDISSDHIGIDYDDCSATSMNSTLGAATPALGAGVSICDSVWRNVVIIWVPAAPVVIGTKYDRYIAATDCLQPGSFVDQCGNTVSWSSTTCNANRNCNVMAVSSGTYTVKYNGVTKESVTLDLEALLNNNQNINGTNIQKNVILGFSASTEGKTNYQAIRNPVLLPVEFVNFYAVKKSETSADLIWSTATEDNSSKFIIERSADGQTWRTAGQTNASGNSSGIEYYRFTDENLSSGTYYYRLQEVDVDGSISYSNVISISLKGNEEVIDIFPNPAGSRQSITINSESYLISLEIVDVNGHSLALHQNIWEKNYVLNDLSIPQGFYFVKIKTENGSFFRKLVIQ